MVTNDNFDEDAYLDSNPDVAMAVKQGAFPTGFAHFDLYGRNEGRRAKTYSNVEDIRAHKMLRLKDAMRDNLPHIRHGLKYDFLTDEVRDEMGIVDTTNISSHDYPEDILSVISKFEDGLILDFGAGNRNVYYSNIVNYEIVNYPSTDVIGAGEILPFDDNSFDAVISNAVLEHVKDPWKCASEMARVLKPDGKLWCSVAFMSPLHGYPNHYFNMTAQGVRSLFEDHLEIEAQTVPDVMTPIYSLRWIVHLWASGLTGETRKSFLDMTLDDLLHRPLSEIEQERWNKDLPTETIFELAACTAISGRKPEAKIG